jgi:hypothetical protein
MKSVRRRKDSFTSLELNPHVGEGSVRSHDWIEGEEADPVRVDGTNLKVTGKILHARAWVRTELDRVVELIALGRPADELDPQTPLGAFADHDSTRRRVDGKT